MTRRDTILKWLAYGIALVLTALVNYILLPLLPLPLPLLLPMSTVAVGGLEGSRFGAAFGIAAGFFMATLGHMSWFSIPLLSLAGWVCGLLSQYVLRRDLWGHVICTLVTLALWEGLHVVSLLTRTHILPGTLLALAGGEALCSLIWSFPLYAINRFCCVHYGRMYHE